MILIMIMITDIGTDQRALQLSGQRKRDADGDGGSALGTLSGLRPAYW